MKEINGLKIERFVCNMVQENCYVVSDETNECAIIDCGALYPEEQQAIANYIQNNHLTAKHLLCTHGHFDHIFGNNFVLKEFGLKAEVHQSDAQLIESLPQQMQMFNLQYEVPAPIVGRMLSGEDVISVGNHQFSVIGTPGHTPGSVFFYCAEAHVAFSGDTLFKQSIGRTDLPGGSMFILIQSLRKVSQLPDETIIMPGHGPETTMGSELASNPYMDR